VRVHIVSVRQAAKRQEGPVIDHVILNVTDLEVSKHFYAQALAPLGYAPSWEDGEFVAMGGDNDFGLYRRDPKGAVHVSFRSPDRGTVDAFHEAGLAAGGTDNGAPGLRPDYGEHYYAAFVLDPDGHNIEVVCQQPAS
jgi:catechol 2,3-dioxygenase-like lactoylglutathione lyase family enzyme